MDIENLHNDFELPSSGPRERMNTVKARFRLNYNNNNSRQPKNDVNQLYLASDFPEKHHVFVQTWGCAHNTSDSEYMAGLLAQYGYQVTLGGGSQTPTVNNPSESENKKEEHHDDASSSCQCSGDNSQCCKDSTAATPGTVPLIAPIDDGLAKQRAKLWVLNSCTVKGPAEDHFRNAVTEGLRQGKLLVVAGCVPQSRPGADYLKGVSIIGVQQIDRIVEVVEETLQGNTVRFLDKKWAQTDEVGVTRRAAGARLDLPKIRRNPLIEILAISTGCLNACTYCKTKHARGVLASYPIDELIARTKQAFDDGVKELWLTSEDLGAYGRDLKRPSSTVTTRVSDGAPTLIDRFPTCLTLIDLLSELVDLIPAGCMLRLGMTNPPYILEQLNEIAAILSHPRVYAFIHVPVQSGSDAVLDRMKREYTAEEFCQVVSHLRDHVAAPPLLEESSATTLEPRIQGSGALTVATDIICGFPNETEADFEDTVELVERFQFPVLYINQFFARPGTPAASMPRKATQAEVKKRTKRLHNVFRSYRPYDNRVGALVRVLVTETSTDGRYWVGHTKAYEQMLVPKVPEAYGRIVLVRVVECDKFFMRSELVDLGPFESIIFADPQPPPPPSTAVMAARPDGNDKVKEQQTPIKSRQSGDTDSRNHFLWDFPHIGSVVQAPSANLKNKNTC